MHFRGVKPTEVKLVTPGENLLRHTAKWKCSLNSSITPFLQNSLLLRRKMNFCAVRKVHNVILAEKPRPLQAAVLSASGAFNLVHYAKTKQIVLLPLPVSRYKSLVCLGTFEQTSPGALPSWTPLSSRVPWPLSGQLHGCKTQPKPVLCRR